MHFQTTFVAYLLNYKIMTKMKRTLFFMLLSALLWGGAATVQAEIYSGYCSANVTWKLDTETGVLEISGTGAMRNYNNAEWKTPWYNYRTSINSVTISDGIASIGDYAFEGCGHLWKIIIPESVISLGNNAFSGDTSLTSITIPDGVTTIGDRAFSGCVSLVYFEGKFAAEEGRCLIIKDTLKAFAPNGLNDYIIPENIKVIGTGAFSGCTGLKSVTIPANVVLIGDAAFSSCSRLAEVKINEGVTAIGNKAFDYCRNLTSVTIPNSVTTIGNRAFRDCRELMSVTIGNGVTAIGDDVFLDCGSLTNVTIGSSSMTIGDGVFLGCESLEEFDGPLASNDHCCLIVDDTLKAFAPSGLTQYTIPDEVKVIGYEAFYDCTGLTSVTIGEGVTTIGSYAFENCAGLTEITIPESVTTIGGCAFRGCKSLTSIMIPDGVTTIGNGAFGDCSGLEKFEGKYAVDNGRCLIVKDTLKAFAPKCGVADYAIFDEVKIIGGYAFSGCAGLTSITIPDGVTSIDGFAFYHCTGLTSVIIPNSVSIIGVRAFMGCSRLSLVTIPYGIKTIRNQSFNSCSLESITIPESVTTIDNGAFYNCSKLKEVTIRSNIQNIGMLIFAYCSSLTKITIYNPIPPNLSGITFSDTDCTKCTLYVPAESVEKYKAAEGWKEFGEILPIVAYDFEAASTITPAENDETITALSTFTLAFDERPALVDSVATVMKADSSAYYPARITASEDGKSFIIALQGNEQTKAAEYSLTEAGTYLLVIPAGTFGDDVFAADPKTGHSNPELVYTYTIKEPEPVEPDEPDEPENPDTPDTPDTPDVPENPDEPENPDTPDVPEVPDEPDEPIVPDEPDEPSAVTETPSDAEHIAVYNLQGVLILETDDAADLKTLQNGAYIVNGKKMIIVR